MMREEVASWTWSPSAPWLRALAFRQALAVVFLSSGNCCDPVPQPPQPGLQVRCTSRTRCFHALQFDDDSLLALFSQYDPEGSGSLRYHALM